MSIPLRPGVLMFLRRRSSVSILLRPPSPRQPVLGVAQAATGQRGVPAADRLHDLARVTRLERADVAAVDRRRRRHPARPETLEAADLGALERLGLGLALEGVEHAPL